MKKPTQKELEQIEKAKSTLKSILNVHMREPFSDNEFEILLNNMKKLKKNECNLQWSEEITRSLHNDGGKLLGTMGLDGYLTLIATQLGIRLLYVKVYGGKGWLGKKIHYSIFLQELDEKIWVPISVQKTLMISISSIGNLFRDKGLLKGFGI
jgi:hypothetical protein